MELTFTNAKVDIWTYSESNRIYKITVKDSRLAYKLNRVLGTYPDDAVFLEDDEPTFKFNASQIAHIAYHSPYIGKIFAQIVSPWFYAV